MRLPGLSTQAPKEYRSTTASGRVTHMMETPSVFIRYPVEHYNKIGNDAIKKAREKEGGYFESLKIPRDLKPLNLSTETDVVNAAQMYVIYPVVEILDILYKGKFDVFGEYAATMGQEWEKEEEEEESEDEDNDYNDNDNDDGDDDNGTGEIPEEKKMSLRYDLVFKTKTGKIIAIIESKRRGQIRRGDFDNAIIPFEDMDKPSKVSAKIQEAREIRGGKNLLLANGLSFTKQVSAYAASGSCEYVALFNWEHLILFRFIDVNIQKRSVGKRAFITWVDEGNGDFIRKALLGWMIEAFASRFKKD